ncbi:hypothetical protein [Streptomyces sp. NPDC055681]
MIVLAALRHDQRLADFAGGNAVSRTTVDRWLKETVILLAARAPRLERVLAKNAREGGSVVLLDGAIDHACPGLHAGGHRSRVRPGIAELRHRT